MQQEQAGGALTLNKLHQTTIFDVPCKTEVIVKLDGQALHRGDYPCGCGFCRSLAVSLDERTISSLAFIDVYDVPEGVEGADTYFH